jgi:hypothetical protein
LAAADPSGTGLRFFLLDLEGVASLAQLSERRKVKNLAQINRTLGQYLRQPEKVFFLKSYQGSGFAEQSLRRRLMENVMAESKRMDRLKARHD